MMMLWWLFGALLVVVIIARLAPMKWSKTNQPSAEEIVRRRYARGEIDREAYERMLDDLHRPDAGERPARVDPARTPVHRSRATCHAASASRAELLRARR